MSDTEVLARQYADDHNLRARQRLWEISRSEPPFDFNQWSVGLMDPHPGQMVLDAGCGNGRPLSLLVAAGCTAVALDRSFGMLREVSHALRAAADVQRLPFPDNAFDAAACFMMLYHVADQESAAAELRRVVRPGGVLVSTTASSDNQSELREVVEGVVGDGWSWNRPSAVSFHLEGGVEILGTAFDSVEVVRAPERQIYITDPDAMSDYVASAADHYARTLPPGRTWEGVVDAVRSATAAAVANSGALVVTARLGALVCR